MKATGINGAVFNFNAVAVKKQGKTEFVKAWKDRLENADEIYDKIVKSVKK